MTEEMRRALDVQNGNAFAVYNHIDLEHAEKDKVIIRLDINDNSKNPLGIVHGGAMYTMADCATGIAAHTDGRRYVTQTSTMHYLRNRKEGVIRAVGQVIHRGRTTCIVKAEITDEEGKLLAMGEFSFFCVDREEK